MARHAAAGSLTLPAAAAASGRFDVSLATVSDDAVVRGMLREYPLPGDVAVTLEREPCTSYAATVEGDVHQTLIARERGSGRVAAIGSRSVRHAFVNGRPVRLGYLGQLRIARPFGRSRALLEDGFARCRALHEAGDARIYLTSVVADNSAARRLLLGLRSPSAPQFVPAGTLSTLILPRSSEPLRNRIRGVEIVCGSVDLLDSIAACLWRNGCRHQFAPCWTSDDLRSDSRTRALAPEDFIVACRGGRVVGCVACWDQRGFKQVVVRSYSARLARWRPVMNAAAQWLAVPRLPDPGTGLDFVYLSHFAVDDDDPGVTVALIAAARSRLPEGVEYGVVGIATDNPLRDILRKTFRHREYRSLLFVAYWADGQDVAKALDDRVPHPEVALL